MSEQELDLSKSLPMDRLKNTYCERIKTPPLKDPLEQLRERVRDLENRLYETQHILRQVSTKLEELLAKST